MGEFKEGKLIVIEGACDGIGKTTQYELLCKAIEEGGYNIAKHHFPTYNTYQGAPVEEYLKGTFGNPNEVSPYFVNTLYALDRGITWNIELKDKYNKGKIIILDRYTTSSLIYQSALIEEIEEKKKFIDFVTDFEYNKIGVKRPSQVIFLSAPFELVTNMRSERKNNEGITNDIYERDIEVMKKVYDSANFIADYLKWDKIVCNDGDKMKSIEEIHKNIVEKIKLEI